MSLILYHRSINIKLLQHQVCIQDLKGDNVSLKVTCRGGGCLLPGWFWFRRKRDGNIDKYSIKFNVHTMNINEILVTPPRKIEMWNGAFQGILRLWISSILRSTHKVCANNYLKCFVYIHKHPNHTPLPQPHPTTTWAPAHIKSCHAKVGSVCWTVLTGFN